MKLPDSIIAATSLFMEIPLLTADKGFQKISQLNLALFED
jgi:predicted nucleic acid-binding protein